MSLLLLLLLLHQYSVYSLTVNLEQTFNNKDTVCLSNDAVGHLLSCM